MINVIDSNKLEREAGGNRTHFSTPALKRAGGKQIMSLDYVLGAIVTLFLVVYLVYALVRPERF